MPQKLAPVAQISQHQKQEKSADNSEDEAEDTSEFRLLNGEATAPKRKKPKKKKAPSAADLAASEAAEVRKLHNITVLGKNVPAPLTSFEDLTKDYKLLPRLQQNVLSRGFAQPTPIQMQALPVLLQRRALMACAPTGSERR